jgi:hypothetical protein
VPLCGSVGIAFCLAFEKVSGAEGLRMVPGREATNVVGVFGDAGSSLAVAWGAALAFTSSRGTGATTVVSDGCEIIERAGGTTEGGASTGGPVTGDDSVSRRHQPFTREKKRTKYLWLSKVLARWGQEEP